MNKKEERIKEIEDALSHGQDGSALQSIANVVMRKELEELKKGNEDYEKELDEAEGLGDEE